MMGDEPTVLFCVGAAKAGTTWLYRHLRFHPECHLRTIKELHYFDTLENGHFDRQIELHRARLSGRDRNENPVRLAHRAKDTEDWIAVLQRRQADFPAYMSYLTEGRGMRPVVADVTPSYALLTADSLRQMAAIVPDARFVYIMRDPLARLWSHLRMLASRRVPSSENLGAMAYDAAERVLAGQDADALVRGDYAGTIERLRKAVDPSRLLILFQDELMSVSGLQKLCAFLDIRMRRNVQFDNRVHQGAAVDLPAAMRDRLLNLLAPQYDFVAREFGSLPKDWAWPRGESA